MPPKRRTVAARSAPTRQQSTLTFHGKQNRVTKQTSPHGIKSTKQDPVLDEDLATTDVKAEAGPDLEEPTTAEKAIDEQAIAEARTSDASEDPLHSNSRAVEAENVLGGRAEQSDIGAVGGERGSGWVSDEEAQARKITDAQIKRYWRRKEQERLAPRVHQQDLTVHEKILREWDMSGQYGPCIGIARLKRWKRANLLGLKPPTEVLAVLLQEMEAGDTRSQRAYVDELLSSRVVET